MGFESLLVDWYFSSNIKYFAHLSPLNTDIFQGVKLLGRCKTTRINDL